MTASPAKFNKHVKQLLSILFILFTSTGFSQTTKVLFIGSSLTAFNNLPWMFGELASASGKDVLVVNGAIGGQNLTDHLSIPTTMDKLIQEDYNYVILENGDYGLMYADTKSEVWSTIDTYIDMIHTHCATTKIIIFMDWAMKNGVVHDGIFYTYETFTQMIYDATLQLAQAKNLIVAPIGVVWDRVVNDMSEYELYAPDNGHPSLSGSYLGACVYYSVIFQESVEGNSFLSSLPDFEANYIQAVASNTVLDNLELWHVITSIEENYIENNRIDKSFALYQNYPNPFNPSTAIQYHIQTSSGGETLVQLKIFDVLGRHITTLVNQPQPAGTYNVTFEASMMLSGVYIYVLYACSNIQSKKMILLR